MKQYQWFFLCVCAFFVLSPGLFSQSTVLSIQDEQGLHGAMYDAETGVVRLSARGTGPTSWQALAPTGAERRTLAAAGIDWKAFQSLVGEYAPYLTTRAVRCVQGVWVCTHTERHPYWEVLPDIIVSAPDFLFGVGLIALEPDGVWMVMNDERAFDRLKSITHVWLQELRTLPALMYDSGQGIVQVSDVLWGWPNVDVTLNVQNQVALPNAQMKRTVSGFEGLLWGIAPEALRHRGRGVVLDSLDTDLRGQTVTAADGAYTWTLRYDAQGRLEYVSQDRDPVFGQQAQPESHQVLVFATKTEADAWHRQRYADVDVVYVSQENMFYISSQGQQYLLGAPAEIVRIFSVVMSIIFDQ